MAQEITLSKLIFRLEKKKKKISQELHKYFEKNGYGKRFRTSFMFLSYMKMISEDPDIIEIMKKNMASNTNNEAMSKLYDIAMNCLK